MKTITKNLEPDELDLAIIQHTMEGLTVKEIGAVLKRKAKTIDGRIIKMKEYYEAKKITHLVIIMLRLEYVKL